jgi:gamma-glutamylcysteine synthetase
MTARERFSMIAMKASMMNQKMMTISSDSIMVSLLGIVVRGV